MALTATYVAQTTVTGPGINPAGTPNVQDSLATAPQSTNAPSTETWKLKAGQQMVFLLPDNTFSFSRVQLMPPQSSTNAKTVLGVNAATFPPVFDTTGLPGWTTGSVTLPAVPGGAIGIYSTTDEELQVAYS